MAISRSEFVGVGTEEDADTLEAALDEAVSVRKETYILVEGKRSVRDDVISILREKYVAVGWKGVQVTRVEMESLSALELSRGVVSEPLSEKGGPDKFKDEEPMFRVELIY